MGWGSATGIFDGAVDVALSFTQVNSFSPDVSPDVKNFITYAVVKEMYTKVQWEDWDTQDESKYAAVLAEIRLELGEIEEDEYNFLYKGIESEDWY